MTELKFSIPPKYQSQVLENCQYLEHHNGDGYILCLIGRRRFHIKINEDILSIHLDENRNGRHKMVKNSLQLIRERRRLVNCYKNLRNLRQVVKNNKRTLKDEFAPNLAKIQKINPNKTMNYLEKVSKWLFVSLKIK